jgi:hypothetical protein
VDYSDSSAPIDPSTATPQQIIAKGHELGAIVILHHPFSDYGFLANQASVNNGFATGWDGFDLLELQSTMDLTGLEDVDASDWAKINLQNLEVTLPVEKLNGSNNAMDAKALLTAMTFWNNGTKKYLSAGSDAHDAHSTTLYSGVIREFAHLDEYTSEAYENALLAGNAYVTCGPVLFPDESNMFGSTITANAGDEIELKLDVQAINGFDTIYLYRNGICIDKQTLNGTTDRTSVTFKTTAVAGSNVWYSFTAVDSNGAWAATNPIWADVTGESATTGEGAFTDVTASNWYYSAVNDVVSRGLLNGVSSTSFGPNVKLTRSMVATVLYRMSGESTGVGAEAAQTFSDVAAGQWYSDAVDWAADNGIVTGYDGKFNPNTNITRQDLATMLYRYARYKGSSTDKSDDLTGFGDSASVSGYATDAMKWVVGEGIVTGRDGNQLAPKAEMIRAEFATMISRYLA